MKKALLIISSIALFVACNDNNTKEHTHEEGTHQHEDGSVHQNHVDTTVKQEEFNAPHDSLSKEKEQKHDHDPDHGHSHTH